MAPQERAEPIERLPFEAAGTAPAKGRSHASPDNLPPAANDDYDARRWPFALTLLFALGVSAGLWALIIALGGTLYRWATA